MKIYIAGHKRLIRSAILRELSKNGNYELLT